MLTDQVIKKLESISAILKNQKRQKRIYKVPPQVESSLYNFSRQIDEWFKHLSSEDQSSSPNTSNKTEPLQIMPMVEQHQRPQHKASLDDLHLEINKFYVLTSRKDNHILEFLRKNLFSADRVSISWEYNESLEYSINSIIINTKTLSATFNLKSENNAQSNYQPLIKFLLDLFKNEKLLKIVFNQKQFIECLKRLWKLETIKFKNTVDLHGTKYFTNPVRGASDQHIDDFILRTLNIQIDEVKQIEWSNYTYPHKKLAYQDPGAYTDQSLYEFNYFIQDVDSGKIKFRKNDAYDSPHPNLPIIYTAIYRAFCQLKIYELFVSRNNSFVDKKENSGYCIKFDDLISNANCNKKGKYIADLCFIRGKDVMNKLGFRIEDPGSVKYKDLLDQAKKIGAKIITTDKYFAYQSAIDYPMHVMLVTE